MARGINKVILIGNLGADPDTRFSAQGSAITNLNLATDESYKDKNTGQMVPKTEWHRIVLFNRLAEISRDYLKKGSKVYIEGRLQTRKWQDQGGQDRYTTEIVGNELQMLDSKPGSFDGAPAQGGYSQQQSAQQAPQQQSPQQQAPQQNQAQPKQAQQNYSQAPAAAPMQAPQNAYNQAPQQQAPQQSQQYAPQAAPQQMAQQAPAPSMAPATDDFDDDIPF